MEKIYYKDEDDFLNAIKPYKIFSGNEGTIYFSETFVYKIINNRFIINPKFIKSLNRLDSTLLTIPTMLIYFFNKNNGESFVGLAMENGGDDLWSLIRKGDLTYLERREIAYQMKEICLYLKKKGYVHGDIKLENFLYKEKNLRLTDINNMKENPDIRNLNEVRMPKFYERLYKKCEDGFYVDYLAINFCMYIRLNQLDIEEISKTITYGFSYNCDAILDSENKVFDNEIYKRMIATFYHPEERKLNKEFLIDYMK